MDLVSSDDAVENDAQKHDLNRDFDQERAKAGEDARNRCKPKETISLRAVQLDADDGE